MNYKHIYKSLIQSAKSKNRKKSKNGEYFETHHIIPAFMFKINPRNKSGRNLGHIDGDYDDQKNIVLLTAREHFLAHVLLYKFLVGTRYEYSAGSSLMLFFNVAKNTHQRVKHGNFVAVGKKYEHYRKIGIESIQKQRTGTFPCVDITTGKSVGSLTKDHPKVISGEYVHHSTGQHKYINILTGVKIWCKTDDPRLQTGDFKPAGRDHSGMNNQNALKDFTKEIAEKLVTEAYNEVRNDKNVFQIEGHFHKSRFKNIIDEKLKILYPHRKSFPIVLEQRLECSLFDYIRQNLDKDIIQCNLYVKFPGIKHAKNTKN